MLVLCLLAVAPAWAQDERRVSSPDGQIEFRLLLAQPENGALFRLAYQVFSRGKRVIDTSFLGLNIWNQEPLLGENVGLTGSKAGRVKGYNWLTAEYMQNGSLGRRINVEVRAADDGVAFRYVIPRSTPLEEILIEDEVTEFDLAGAGVSANARPAMPFVTERSGAAWIAITEVAAGDYPRVYLARADGTILVTRMARPAGGSGVAYEGTTPLTCPWRVVLVGADRERLMQSELLRGLGR